MKSVLFLLLFFSVSWGQLEASVSQEEDLRMEEDMRMEDLRTVEDDDDVPPELPVLWDELRGLKDLVLSVKAAEVEQRQAIRSLETRLRDGELEDWTQRRSLDGLEETVEQQKEELRRTMELNSDLRRKLEEQSKVRAVEFSSEVSTLHFRLNASERSMDDLKKKNSALAAELPFLQTRLRASENTVEQLRRKSTVLSVRLCNAESLMEELMRQTSAFPTSNSSSQTETELEELNSNTQVLQSRLNSLEKTLNSSAERDKLSLIRVQDDAVKQLQVRLNSAETQIQQLQTDRSDQTSKPMKLQRKVNTTESLLDTMNTALEVRLSVSEKHLEDLKTENTELEVRLRVSEKHLEELKTENTVQSVQLSLMESRLTDSHNKTTELEVRLRVSDKQLEDVKTENTVQAVQLSLMESRLTDSHNNTTALEVSLRSTETQQEQLENHTAALEVRLSVSEKHLEDVKTENTVQSVQLSLMESRLTDSHNKTTELEVRLRVSDKQLEDVKTENTVLSFRLNETDDCLTNTNSGDLKVAFSAGLTDSGSVGPFDEETTLIFSKTITNIGQAYNQTSGVFTAPVRGLYFFSFTAADYLKGYMGLHLYRNNQPVVFSLVLNDHGGYAFTSGGVALQLEEGDGVRLSLPASYRLYDDSRNFSVFSGFLLFPL
ncbi:uncharacterized protein LOC142943603 [Anarhichas minor]|uniref:uncharacterized protein LOC142943603 n=1 Tax=Anarhichas minor TaxID=65739 RepID=UPI003F74072C